MKRDWDVIRDVLVMIEELSPQEASKASLGVARNEPDQEKVLFMEHLFLLKDAGFIEGGVSNTMQSKAILSPRLTWSGHELLSTIRSKPVWEKVKSTASDKGIDLSFDAVIALGKAALAAVIGGSI